LPVPVGVRLSNSGSGTSEAGWKNRPASSLTTVILPLSLQGEALS
jgi:hypothetical protein